jgi:hypothetical protein
MSKGGDVERGNRKKGERPNSGWKLEMKLGKLQDTAEYGGCRQPKANLSNVLRRLIKTSKDYKRQAKTASKQNSTLL